MKFLKISLIIAGIALLPLQEAGAQFLGSKSPSFNNQLIDAADIGNEAAVLSQLQSGTAVDARGSFGVTALMRAAFRGNKSIASLLLDSGANPNLADKGGATALHLAAKQGNDEIVGLLLKYNAHPDAMDNDGWTPLMRAALNKHEDVVEKLVDAGANVNLTNDLGETALMHAANSGDQKIVNMLLTKGANAEVTSKSGNSALKIAEKQRNDGLKQALLASSAHENSEPAANPSPVVFADEKPVAEPSLEKPKSIVMAESDVATPSHAAEKKTKKGKKEKKGKVKTKEIAKTSDSPVVVQEVAASDDVSDLDSGERILKKHETRKIIKAKPQAEAKIANQENKPDAAKEAAKEQAINPLEMAAVEAPADSEAAKPKEEPKTLAAEKEAAKEPAPAGDLSVPPVEVTAETAKALPESAAEPKPALGPKKAAKKKKGRKAKAKLAKKQAPASDEPLSMVYKKEMKEKNITPIEAAPEIAVNRKIDVIPAQQSTVENASQPSSGFEQMVGIAEPNQDNMSHPKSEVEVAEAIRVPVSDYSKKTLASEMKPQGRYKTGGNVWVEVSIFESLEDANNFADKSGGGGLSASVVSSGPRRHQHHVVKIGNFGNRDEAEKFCRDNFPDDYEEPGVCRISEGTGIRGEKGGETQMPGYLGKSRYERSTAVRSAEVTDKNYQNNPNIYWIQLGSFNDMVAAKDRWKNIKLTNKDILGNIDSHYVSAGEGKLFLRAGPFFSGDLARSACDTLRKKFVPCFSLKD